MVGIQSFRKFIWVLLLIGFCTGITIAQDPKTDKKAAKEALIIKIVTEQDYKFTAQSVTPMGGRYRNLTTDYTLKVSKDTIKCDLPYFGRSYTASIGTTEGGIKFTSTSFDYQLTDRKKGGWDISIKPKDVSDVQQMTLTIFTNGTASLQVANTNRQPISFNGYVEERKKKK